MLSLLGGSTTTGSVIVRAHAIEFPGDSPPVPFLEQADANANTGAEENMIVDRALAVVVPVLEIA